MMKTRHLPRSHGFAAKTGRRCTGVLAALAGVLLLAPTPAEAVRVDFEVYQNQTDVASDQIDVWVDVLREGNDWFLLFHNDTEALADLSLMEVYFEFGFRNERFIPLGIENRAMVDTFGVNFDRTAEPDTPPSAFALNWTANAFSYGAAELGDETANGVNNDNEVLFFRADRNNLFNTDVNDLVDALNTRGTRIAALMRTDDPFFADQVALATSLESIGGPGPLGPQQPVTGPLPAAVWPGLALLGALAMRRKRRAR